MFFFSTPLPLIKSDSEISSEATCGRPNKSESHGTVDKLSISLGDDPVSISDQTSLFSESISSREISESQTYPFITEPIRPRRGKSKKALKILKLKTFRIAGAIRHGPSLRPWRRGIHMPPYDRKVLLQCMLKKHRHRRSGRAITQDSPSITDEHMIFRFTDLPNEIIMDIVDLCDFDALRSLTSTSHSMCNIAFPNLLSISRLSLPRLDQYLSKDTPHGIVDINSPEKALALSIWRRQTSFHCISVLMLALYSDVPALVDRILAFFETPMPIKAPFAPTINIYTYSVENIHTETCRLLYGLQGSGCSHLSITGFIMANVGHRFPGIPLMEATDTGYERLEVFKTHGSFPFLSPILPFTMSNILSSRLREFVFTTNDFSVAKWAAFLRDLVLANLEILAIGGSISLVTLLKFLRRHRKLQHLSLTGINVPFHPPVLPRGFSLRLTELRFITAPALYISEILRYLPHAPHLSQVLVRTDMYKSQYSWSLATFSRSALKALFGHIKRFPSLNKVTFAFGASGLTDFCDTSQDQEPVPPEALLFYVNTITLRKSFGGPFDDDALTNIIGWLALFPSLLKVELFEDGVYDRSEWMNSLRQMDIVPIVRSFL